MVKTQGEKTCNEYSYVVIYIAIRVSTVFDLEKNSLQRYKQVNKNAKTHGEKTSDE